MVPVLVAVLEVVEPVLPEVRVHRGKVMQVVARRVKWQVLAVVEQALLVTVEVAPLMVVLVLIGNLLAHITLAAVAVPVSLDTHPPVVVVQEVGETEGLVALEEQQLSTQAVEEAEGRTLEERLTLAVTVAQEL